MSPLSKASLTRPPIPCSAVTLLHGARSHLEATMLVRPFPCPGAHSPCVSCRDAHCPTTHTRPDPWVSASSPSPFPGQAVSTQGVLSAVQPPRQHVLDVHTFPN